jgi:urea transporter
MKNHVTEYLRAVSQTLFFRNAGFGFGLLVLFLIFDRTLFLYGFVGSVIGYGYSVTYSTPKVLRDWGLITVNGLFFGISMASLFAPSPALAVCLILGALSIPLVTKAAFEVLQHWKLSPFVLPYILSAWVFWLCARGAAVELRPQQWPEVIATLPHFQSHYSNGSLPAQLMISALMGMGRLLFIPNPVFGLSLLILIAAFSPGRGLYFSLGTVAATVAAFLISTGSASWEYGYFSYSAGLVGLGLASFPEKFAARTILLFCMISCFLTIASEQLLGSLHLPSLSIPYVVTLWLGALSRVPRVSVNWNTNAIAYKSPLASTKRAKLVVSDAKIATDSTTIGVQKVS